MNSVTVLVTGGAGFVGSHLVKKLCEMGYDLYVLAREGSNLSKLDSVKDKVSFFNMEDLDSIFEKKNIDIVIHLATDYGRKKEGLSGLVNTNVVLGLKLLDNCVKYNVGLFVNTDSFFNDSKYKNTYMQNYTLSKKQFSDWLKVTGNDLNVVNMKLHHVYGPYDNEGKFIPWLMDQLLKSDNVDLTSGDQLRDFIYVDDVVSAYVSILINCRKNKKGFVEYIVSTGEKTKLSDFCMKLQDSMRLLSSTENATLSFGKKTVDDEIYDVYNDNTDLIRLGWRPEFTIEQGVEELVKSHLRKF
ncbi:hypothetical protein A8139_20875 [Marinomonas primoryensis]|uniref:NAD-dependent epimerase/dehydratase domain-containing protein n=1 Tax=Marinomonas primoryensis TaxID=178399 RepID=A0A2Z4PUB5_9GAMM|nr:NAD(P)-dependent oxidoreductase [Marinomonas primoryensis]AWY01060.1 hypothetical protein A8139_14530 [Marinomonas primoryensis]AWY02115.1 hypothetical protein A8139_20875 [Marinomonas primoryensis]